MPLITATSLTDLIKPNVMFSNLFVGIACESDHEECDFLNYCINFQMQIS